MRNAETVEARDSRPFFHQTYLHAVLSVIQCCIGRSAPGMFENLDRPFSDQQTALCDSEKSFFEKHVIFA